MKNLVKTLLLLLLPCSQLIGQGELVEGGYIKDVLAFSKIPMDALWDYLPNGNIAFDSLNKKNDWQKVNPIYLKDATGKPLAWSGIGWFRQTFTVSDSLNGKLIALRVGHLGASEIYLDDKLVASFGDVFATFGKNKSYLPRKPFTGKLNNAVTHTLKVRYATHDFDKVIQPRIFFGFSVALSPVSESYPSISLGAFHGIFSMSLYISFTLFFFLVYLFYPQKLGSLFSALLMLNFAILFSSAMLSSTTTSASIFALSNLIWKFTVAMADGWGLLYFYVTYYQKLPRRTWLLVLLMFVNLLAVIYPAINSPILSFVNILLILERYRIIIIGIRDKRSGFWILAVATIIGNIAFLVFIADVFHLFSVNYTDGSITSIIKEVGGFISDLTNPLMLSLLLAWEFGSSNRDLQKQLGAVQELSKENLEKELEKQQILATQNETLEKQVTERTAELQYKNRDLEIEAALERVRSKTMAMQHSNQLREIAGTTLEQLQRLGFTYGACSIIIMDAETGDMTWWISGFENDYPASYGNIYFEHPFYLAQLNNWKEGKKYAVMVCEGEAKKEYDKFIFSKTEFVKIPIELQKIMQSFEKVTFSNAYMKYGALSWSTEPLEDEYAKILQRFAGVFEQSYTRFLDLQKAEAQAREAQIELALETIRSRLLAMHNSNELKDVMSVMFKKLTELDVLLGTVGIQIFDEKTMNCDLWIGTNLQAVDVSLPYDEKLIKEAGYLKDCWDAKRNGQGFLNKIYTVEEKNKYFNYVFSNNDETKIPLHVKEFLLNVQNYSISLILEKNSALFLDSFDERLYSNEQIEVLKRVVKVFEQAYIRFLDLQKAEAQAREAQIEVALERVRAKAMAMQNSNELSLLIGSVYAELTKLDIELNRCFFMLFDPKTLEVTWWMASHEVGANSRGYKLPYHEHAPQLAYIKGWKERQEKWRYVAGGDEKKDWDEYIFAETELSQLPEFIISNMKSVKTINLSASFYNFGCLTTGTLEPLGEESFEILVRFAKVFDSTYTRFLDLQKAEAQAEQAKFDLIQIQTEKAKAEEALKILKATQNQLIQSEKLASLGELTAGIAHEIQNPLNFVNNFAELSVDLAKDINSEIRKSEMDKEYLEELLTDLTHNQEKINLHGKRASSIVKGMLEHSRASTGVKELTDINKLCDEYFRLAYHGLRAKDKDFNCELISKFDETLPKIEIIPQDVGRVVLNLINNAFYAVNEQANKKRSGNFESSPNVENLRVYKPMVTVTTQKTDNGIEIRVKDNGTGMPENVKEKIFQPFFTTKPTGSGTGLGLSLAYDIITKGHSGSLKVESKEGEGSEFVVKFQLKNN